MRVTTTVTATSSSTPRERASSDPPSRRSFGCRRYYSSSSISKTRRMMSMNNNTNNTKKKKKNKSSHSLKINNAGAFTKLIEIPPARFVARGLMVPARYFVDGKRAKENVRTNELVRVRNTDGDVPQSEARLLPLSGYDVGEVPFVMQVVSYYRNPLDAGMMRSALEKALEKYPILAGRLDLQTPGFRNKGVRLTNAGVPFRVVNESFEDGGAKTIDDLPQDFASESRRFLDFAPWIDLMLGDAPAFTVKITNLPNGGGSVLGVCMSHAVSDGQGFVEFLITWAEIAKGNLAGNPLGDPIFDRSLLPTSDFEEKEDIERMLEEEHFVGAGSVDTLVNAVKAGRALAPDFLRFPAGNRSMIKISKENIEKIKAASNASNENEALSAHAWLQLSKLSGLPTGSDFQHVTVVSARGGSKGLPPMYFGNACVGVKTGALKIGDCGDDIAKARDMIKPGLRKMLKDRSKYLMLTESAFRAGVNAYDWDCLAFMSGEMCWCNNLVEIYKKLYELDFGSGTPELALPPELNDIVQINASRPTEPGMPAGENGVEMFVNMPPSVMERVNANVEVLSGARY